MDYPPLYSGNFFIGITGRYMLNFHEVIQEKMLFLDISIYFLLFAVLSATLFLKRLLLLPFPILVFYHRLFLIRLFYSV